MSGTFGRGPKKRILVVEDDADVRDALVLSLQDEGFDVQHCADGHMALALLKGGDHPDLIILDLMLPRIDGWRFRAAQRSEPGIADIPVVVISAGSSAQARAIHADGYIEKPIVASDLLALIHRSLLDRDCRDMERRLFEADHLLALGTIAAGFGHEVRNALTYTLMNLGMLETMLAKADSEIRQVLGTFAMALNASVPWRTPCAAGRSCRPGSARTCAWSWLSRVPWRSPLTRSGAMREWSRSSTRRPPFTRTKRA